MSRKLSERVTIYLARDLHALMTEAVARGDAESLSEPGRRALRAWADEYREQLSRNRRYEAERALGLKH